MKILKLEQLSNWKPIIMTMPLTQYQLCPACLQNLLIIAVVGRVRVGGCDTCGYMGYIDRPTAEWFKEFYHEKWDRVGQEEKESTLRYLQEAPITRTVTPLEMLLLRTKARKDRPILDIGCGFGRFLKFAKSMGCKDLYGVEKSNHRADVAEKLGFTIYRGGFEDVDFGGKKFGVIAHHHVLEHVENPDKFIEKCASMQEEGDYMILGMPNNLGEPTMGVLMFLPHIHSFAITTIRRLLGRHNYEIADFTLTNKNSLNVVAIKRNKKVGIIGTRGFMDDGINKLIKGLDYKHHWFKRRLIWSKGQDNAKSLPTWKTPKGFKDPRSFIVQQGKLEIPIEIESPYLFIK